MRTPSLPFTLTTVPFSRTRCGVDFNIAVGDYSDLQGALMEHPTFKTDYFQLFFFDKVKGNLRYGFQQIELKDHSVLVLSPHVQQEWHIEEGEVKARILFFRHDFLNIYLADPFFTYRLLYCHQTDFAPILDVQSEYCMEYDQVLNRIQQELAHPVGDSYHIMVSLLHYLLILLNRQYATCYDLPFAAPKNYHAYEFKQLLEQHIRTHQHVADYADMLHISRVTLNAAVQAQYGQTATHLLKQRLLAEIKNEILFTNKTASELAYEFHFSEPGHFMRFFKKQTGQTITEFKEEYKGHHIASA